MLDSDKLAIAAHLHVAMRRKLGRVTDVEWMVRSDSSAAFYLPWFRAWELLVGSLLAGSRLDRIPAPLKALLTAAGVAAIVIACLSYWNRMRFPGVSALLPVLGTCAVIAGTGARSPVNWALGSAPMRFIGKISYSLYLVHWPVTSNFQP